MRTSRPLCVAATAATALTLIGSIPAAAGKGAKPGPDGPVITLGRHLDMTRGYSDMVMSANGTAYVGWIAAPGGGGPRTVSACVLPPGAHACKGGVQSTDAIDGSSAASLHMLMVNGTPTLLWLHNNGSTGAIAAATINPSGVLSAGADAASGPNNGVLLDATVGPGGTIWTITYDSGLPSHLEVHDGLNAPGQSINTPWAVGFASLAFAGGKPVIVATDYGAIGTAPAYSTSKGNGYTAFKNVKHTWAIGTNVGLTSTSTGLRLTTGVGNANYWPVVVKWTGHGFAKPRLTGDKNACAPDSHDTSSDKSGRLIDVTNECGKITVSNLPTTTHAAVFRFASGGTVAGNNPQIASSPRGHAWVLWGIEDSAPQNGDKLMVRHVLLGDTHSSKSAHGKHGKVTVTGPTSCLPADAISVAVKGNPDRGWKVGSKKLTLNGHKVGGSLNGAALKPGKKYTLAGTVVFTGGGHEKVTAKLAFRSCPNP